MAKTDTIEITVLHFAMVAEWTGRSEQSVRLPEGATPESVWRDLVAELPTEASALTMMVAINEAYATMATPLQDGDTLAFIPPVAGG